MFFRYLSGGNAPQAPQQSYQQQATQAAPAPQQAPTNNFDDFDEDIPF